jgi:hypothetical protein
MQIMGTFMVLLMAEKKCTIFSLEDGNRVISDELELRKHIVDFYKNLFGRKQRGPISIGAEMWQNREKLSRKMLKS